MVHQLPHDILLQHQIRPFYFYLGSFQIGGLKILAFIRKINDYVTYMIKRFDN